MTARLLSLAFIIFCLYRIISRHSNKTRGVRTLGQTILYIGLFIAVAVVCLGGGVAEDLIAHHMDAYKEAVQETSSSAKAQQALGSPIRSTWGTDFSANIQGDSGEATFKIPVKGDLHKGTIYAAATKDKQWTLTDLYLVPEGSTAKIQLAH